MPYRADVHALESRRESIEKELADLRARANELARVEKSEAELQAELASVRRMLDEMSAPKRGLPILDNVRIASPCNAKWEDMIGDPTSAAVRFCGQCQKNVFNLSEMTKADAERVLKDKEGNLCARIYRRADGTVITADCPVGVRKKRVRRAAVAVVGGGMLAVAGVMLGQRPAARMGTIAMQGEVAIEEPHTEMMGDVAPTTAPVPGPEVVTAMGTVAIPMPPPPNGKTPPAKIVHPEPKRSR